jgi:hypothetical protein
MWPQEFRRRIDTFANEVAHNPGDTAISIKVRVTSGCFHREHSPIAYSRIDAVLGRVPAWGHAFRFVEHESGPEILVYVAAATAGISLAKSVIDLVVAILKARSDGIKKGDSPSHPVELIVRRSVEREHVAEEVVLRLDHSEDIDPIEVERKLRNAVQKLVKGRSPETDRPANKALQPTSRASNKKSKSKRRTRGGSRLSAGR